jgi:galactose mutarotase-like enzyme
MADKPDSWLALGSSELSAEIDPHGAQLSTLRDRNGLDLLWNGDPAVWAGRAPVLFPIVGALAGGAYRVGGRSYRLGRHGFARGKPFEVVEHDATGALLRLAADESTFAVYPFAFELYVGFAVSDSMLGVRIEVRNTGREDLPASLGFHPAFRWPLPYGEPRDAHSIEFATHEPDALRRIDGEGLVTPVEHPTPIAHGKLDLTDGLFREDALIFDQIKSRKVLYGATQGPRIEVSYPDSPYLGIWSKPGAGFICIEPWQGLADSQGFSGEIWQKTGMRRLAPGEAASLNVTLDWLPG